MPVTIKEIARLSGLSYPTVSQILNNRPVNFRPETRKKVLEIAEKLGYRPNAYARAMSRGGSFGAIGLLLSRTIPHSALFGDILYTMEEELRKHDAHLVIGDMPDEKLADPGEMPKVLREWSVDGLLINYTHNRPAEMEALIQRHQIPSIWINTKLDQDCVHPDDHGAGYKAAELLAKAGHREIGFLNFVPTAHYSQADRFAGAAQAARKAGMKLRDLQVNVIDPTERLRLCRRLLAGPVAEAGRPTGIVCYGRDEADTLMYAAALEGVGVPDDLSVVAIFHEVLATMGVAITQMKHPMQEIGRVAVRMLMQKIAADGSPLPGEALPFELVPGQTVARPPAR